MSSNFAAGLWTAGSWRCARALILLAMLAVLTMAIASPAQAHEPYLAKAWGNNTNGQLGDGATSGPESCGPETNACSTKPVQVSGLSGVIAVAGGHRYSLALLENGTVMAWGLNNSGQLGDGTTTDRHVPVAVKELSHVKAIAAGANHALALLEDGTVMAWGLNNGQLGDATTTDRHVPVAVCAAGEKAPCAKHLSGVKAVAAGGDHSLALLEGGTVVAWGNNSNGELGDGTETTSTVPVAVCAAGEKAPCAKHLSGVKAVAAGANHALALLEEKGTVMAWGRNEQGQLGNGSETKSDVPVAVSGLTGVRAISAGGYHALAVLEEKEAVMAWGYNTSGQLGDGTSEGPETCGAVPFTFACSKKPVAVQNLPGGISAVSVGGFHSLVLLGDGTVLAWGKNEQGQLGDGLRTGPEGCGTEGSCSKLPVKVCAEGAGATCSGTGPYLLDAKGIGAGQENSYAFGPPPPTVTAVSPKEGPRMGGTSVTITGAELEEASAVKFGSTNATNVKVSENGTKITALAPPGSGTVDVTVTTPAGTSKTSSADQFTYIHIAGVEPDFGRCVEAAVVKEGKKLHYGGAFKDPGCTKKNAAKRGQYEWLPEAGGTFTSVLKEPALQTTGTGKVLITCASGKAEGKITGPTTFKVTKLVFSGCAESPSKGLTSECQNKGSKNGEIKANELAGELGFIKRAKNTKRTKVGVDLKPASGSTLASFECGGANEITGEGSGTGTARELEGSVIGQVATINAMTKANAVTYTASKGHQVPESFQGGAKDTLSMNSEPTTFVASEEVKDSEEVEINTKF